MSLPPDRPTERLPPQRPPLEPQPPPVVEERYVAPAADPNAVLLRLEDAIDSVRTGLMIVGVIAVAALGVAIYALMKDDGGAGAGNAASDARVSQLDNRIDRLSRQVQDARSDARSNDDAAALGDRVEALEGTVKELADRPAPGDATDAVQELSDRIDDLTADVEQLKSAAPAP